MRIDEPRKAKTVSRHGAYARIDRFCPNCMKMLYRKEQRCPNCGQAIKWNRRVNDEQADN
jgi:predicted amidophosphoribosyltransferase